MNLKRRIMIVLVVVSIMAIQSCSNNDESNFSRVKLKLIDNPGDYLEVNVSIVDIQYNSSEDQEGWRSFESFEGPVTVNLTKLVGGNNLILADEFMPVGILKQIRLVLGDGNNLLIEGEVKGEDDFSADLETPSAQQSGLKLNIDEVLEAGFSYTFILDWDVQESIVKTGVSGKYILKPVIRVEAEARTGSIEGIVTGEKTDDEVNGAVPLQNVLVMLYKVDAIEGDDPVANTSTNENGYFLFEGLPTMDYKIKIEHDGYEAYEMTDITVVVNTVQDAGTIELVSD